jgi:predicted  nucleic acid-binding Zn-ribbon protein
MSLPSEPQLTLGRKKVNAYDTMRRTGKRMKRKLSGELAHENSGGTAPINNQFQVKAFAAQFELEAAKQKQSQLKTKMEDLAQVANSKEIELEKALAKIKALEEEAKRANAHKELEAATKAAQVERKKADEMEEAVRKMRLEREELERKRLEVEKLRKELEDKERAELSSSDGVSRSNSKGGLSSSGGSKRLSKSGKRGSKGEKGEKGDSSASTYFQH